MSLNLLDLIEKSFESLADISCLINVLLVLVAVYEANQSTTFGFEAAF